MVLVAQHHPAAALHVRLRIGRILRQRAFAVSHAVRLDVGLVHDIEPVTVAEVVPLRVVRVVACTHRVDIQLLHDAYILDHPLTAHGISLQGIHLVTVGALDQHGLPVHEQLPAANLHRAESDALRDGLGHPAAVRHGDFERIEVRLLGRPFRGTGHVQLRGGCAVAGFQRSGSHLRTRRVAQRQREGFHLRRGPRLHGQHGIAVVGVEPGRDAHVLEVRPVARHQLHTAGDARQPPEVLILQIRAVRPAVDLQRDEVLARPEVLRHVELRRQLAVLAVTDEAAVDPDVNVRRGGADRKRDLLPGPAGRHVERAAVGTHVILGVGDVRRIVPEVAAPCVAHIDIDRIAVSVQLPDSRHGHRVPCAVVVIRAPDAVGPLRRVAHPFETPHAVERQPLARLERGAHRQPVHGIDLRIAPFGPRLRRSAPCKARQEPRRQGQDSSFHDFSVLFGFRFVPSVSEVQSTRLISHRRQSKSSR